MHLCSKNPHLRRLFTAEVLELKLMCKRYHVRKLTSRKTITFLARFSIFSMFLFNIMFDFWFSLFLRLAISPHKNLKLVIQLLIISKVDHHWLACKLAETNQLAISQLRTAKHLWIVWRDKAKWQKTLKVKIRARNYKRCLITSKKKPQKLFAVSVPRLMTGALYRTVPPNNLCMLCGLN